MLWQRLKQMKKQQVTQKTDSRELELGLNYREPSKTTKIIETRVEVKMDRSEANKSHARTVFVTNINFVRQD